MVLIFFVGSDICVLLILCHPVIGTPRYVLTRGNVQAQVPRLINKRINTSREIEDFVGDTWVVRTTGLVWPHVG